MNFKFVVNKDPVAVEFESETIAEGVAILADNSNELGRLFDVLKNGSGGAEGEAAPPAPARRGRRSKNQPDPVAAAAPAPVPVPAPAPAAPVPTPAAPVAPATDQPPEIPGFLKRSASGAAGAAGAASAPAPAAPAATAAAPVPAPPPAAPAAVPPAERLSDKVIAEIKRRKGDGDGQDYANWLADYRIVAAGTTFDEAVAVLQFTSEADLAPVAKALEIG